MTKRPIFHSLCVECGKSGVVLLHESVLLCQGLPYQGAWRASARLRGLHRVCGKHLFVLPPDGGLCGKALGYIQKPLVGAAPEAQGDIVLGFHKAAVHQNIQQTQQLIGDLTAGRAGNTAGQLLPGVAGIAPDALIRV